MARGVLKKPLSDKKRAQLARITADRIARHKRGELVLGRHKSLATLKREADKDAREKFLLFASTQVLPIGDALVEKAKTGDIQAIKEFFDRTFGKAAQLVEHTGEIKLTLRAVSNHTALPVQGDVLRIITPDEPRAIDDDS